MRTLKVRARTNSTVALIDKLSQPETNAQGGGIALVSLRVAFQGGGARLVTLIAAAHALRDMQSRGEVNVEMVAGASAGSIAACMFSQGGDFEAQIERIRKIGPSLLRELKKFPKGRPAQLWNIMNGQPLLNEIALRKLVEEIFYDGSIEKNSRKLSSFSTPTFITLSDIFERRKVVIGPEEDNELINILLDSCALPVVFRTHASASSFVDGGISSNLPADLITNATPSDVVPLAFRFRGGKSLRRPTNIAEYAVSIISTAIDASVEFSANSVIQNGGHVCELPDHFDTLDFSEALSTGLHEQHYKTTKHSIETSLKEALQPYRDRLKQSKLLSKSPRPEQALFNAHDTQMASFPFQIKETTTVVCAHSLYDEGDKRYSPNDHIYQTYTLTSSAPVLFLRMGIPFGAVAVQETESCLVKDRLGNDLETFDFPVRVADPQGRFPPVSYILIYLAEPAPASIMPLTVTYRTAIPGSMKGLLGDSGEWMKARTGNFANLSTENQVLLLPKDFPPVELEDLLKGALKLPRERQQKATVGTADNWKTGAKMTEKELAQIFSKPGTPAQLGWRAVGWSAKKVPKDHFSGAIFISKRLTST